MTTLAAVPAADLPARQLERVAAIYADSFSAGLRVPFAELSQPPGTTRLLVALAGPDPAGFAATRLLGSAGWTFLRYFAIDRARRSQGYGREFWRILLAELAGTGWPARVVFEVEDPAEAPGDPAERLVRHRRLAFWTAAGARLLPVPGYVMPDYTGAGTEPVLLMAGAAPDSPRWPESTDAVRSLVRGIYTDRYGLAPGDPLVSRALASIPDQASSLSEPEE
jgi:hypothetical protein